MLASGRSYLLEKNFDATIFVDIEQVDSLVVDAKELTAKSTREVLAQAYQSPLGEKRLLLIKNAEMLSDVVQNILLKTLEEPPSRLVIILATDNPGRLLPTVRSRLENLTKTAKKDDGELSDFDFDALANIKDRPALLARLIEIRDGLRKNILQTASKNDARRLILIDQAITRLEANCSQKIVLDSLLLHLGALSDIEIDDDH